MFILDRIDRELHSLECLELEFGYFDGKSHSYLRLVKQRQLRSQ